MGFLVFFLIIYVIIVSVQSQIGITYKAVKYFTRTFESICPYKKPTQENRKNEGKNVVAFVEILPLCNLNMGTSKMAKVGYRPTCTYALYVVLM